MGASFGDTLADPESGEPALPLPTKIKPEHTPPTLPLFGKPKDVLLKGPASKHSTQCFSLGHWGTSAQQNMAT